ncbi:MAG: 2OG-Fe dioxygenase family protein [Myxococcales bacterium]|nr:2OG-Fe dioxygenase family protein [Myxococcales bacterium]
MQLDLDRDLDDAQARARLTEQGFATLTAPALAALADTTALPDLARYWDDLPPDPHLRDGGHYRARRHGCAIVHLAGGVTRIEPVLHRAHWQSTTYNALHGGLERWFEPLAPALVHEVAWRELIGHLAHTFAAVRRPVGDRFFLEAHPFRIDTDGGVGRPTPEGAHRDGVDFVAVILVARHAIRGGETRVFEAAGPVGLRFTLLQPWSAVLLDDTRVIHESTPIVPIGPARGHRDTLVLTYRSGGFQAP